MRLQTNHGIQQALTSTDSLAGLKRASNKWSIQRAFNGNFLLLVYWDLK